MHDTFAETFTVYILASRPRGVLYVGMTSDLSGRALEHREGLLEGVTKRYGVDRLVYFEHHDDAAVAARRERNLKRWRRGWKIEMIEKNNPTWRDLFSDVLVDRGFADEAQCQFPLPGPRLSAIALCAIAPAGDASGGVVGRSR